MALLRGVGSGVRTMMKEGLGGRSMALLRGVGSGVRTMMKEGLGGEVWHC